MHTDDSSFPQRIGCGNAWYDQQSVPPPRKKPHDLRCWRCIRTIRATICPAQYRNLGNLTETSQSGVFSLHPNARLQSKLAHGVQHEAKSWSCLSRIAVNSGDQTSKTRAAAAACMRTPQRGEVRSARTAHAMPHFPTSSFGRHLYFITVQHC